MFSIIYLLRGFSFLNYTLKIVTSDLSIGYIKLNTKTQNIFCCVNENLITFLSIHFDRGDKKTEGEKKFSFLKCIQKSNVIKKTWLHSMNFTFFTEEIITIS